MFVVFGSRRLTFSHMLYARYQSRITLFSALSLGYLTLHIALSAIADIT